MKQRNDGGFSLVEVLVAMVLLAAVVIPTCSSLVMSFEMNTKADEMMQAQLAVSSAVESLMAEGITEKFAEEVEDGKSDRFPGVTFDVERAKENEETLPYYNVKVTDAAALVEVTTTIRAAASSTESGNTGEGDGT